MKQTKQQMRKRAYAARAGQTDKDRLSDVICKRVMALAEYQAADTVMWYLHCRTEVRTHQAVQIALKSEKKVIIPYCTQDNQGAPKLGLWHLQRLDELVAGTWQIPEPPQSRWGESGKEVVPKALDLVIVPGVAFDQQGQRLGNGMGYYDRLLAQVRTNTHLFAICFEAQLYPDIPVDAYDIVMHKVVTERQIY